jgi:hypothetical protein
LLELLPSRTPSTNIGGRKGILRSYWWECELVQPLWKTIWSLLKKLKIDLLYDPAILFLRIYPKECDSGYYKGTCTPMFIAPLLIIAKLWKQPRSPTNNEQIKKMCIYTQWDFIQQQRRMRFLSFAGKWMELENIILSEVSQAQKAKNHM